ncbi:tyrosine-type recombinase/integrase [Mesobacillus foraminis]|uniref:tyrosine-type recombinase/integrase n=1 Tax=Mesobacillus foraminis TaxID=279826 RepID=UPI0010488471|nr:tyrosine-type recombinase/integrase [Mesobacillus foraminis]
MKVRVKDLKGTHLTLKEQKTGKIKTQIISPTLRKEIDRYIEGKQYNDLLFPSKKGTEPITRVQAYRILNEVAAQCGVEEIGTHTRNKTFSYHFYQRTKDIVTLQHL